MDTIIFLVVLFVLLPIIMIVQDQGRKSENKNLKMSEKIGKAVGTYAHGVASEVSGLAQSITESDESRAKRELSLSIRYNIEDAISGKVYNKERLLEEYNDDQLKRFNVTNNDWQRVIKRALAIGEITKHCVYKGEVQKNHPSFNEDAYNGNEWNDGKSLREALDYLGIPKEDWIKWGYATLSMYEVGKEIDEFLEKIS